MARKKKKKGIKREHLPDEGGAYFVNARDVVTFSSGCALLDCVLGGGWALSRIANIVGDKSAGKTLLTIEGSANFERTFPKGWIRYAESEAAFDETYAASIGMPVDKIEFPDNIMTVEDLFEDLEKKIKKAGSHEGLYIVDSLDALSDRAETQRAIDEGTYGGNKPKILSQMFRRLTKMLKKTKISLIVVSQERDKIGVTFGRKTTRSGGRALDFYASQILWLAHVGRIKATRQKVERVVGVNVRAKCEKNKVAPAFRECDFPIYFNYGVEDVVAGLDWLKKVGRLQSVGLSVSKLTKYKNQLAKMDFEDYSAERRNVQAAVFETWNTVEERFLPKRRKYG